jgi:hypothetical protein
MLERDCRTIRKSWTRSLVLLALLVMTPIHVLGEQDSRYDRRPEHDRYVFATTRSLSDMDIHPVMRVILMPGAVVLDLLLFPLAAIADMAS